jgi:hypothetical protein
MNPCMLTTNRPRPIIERDRNVTAKVTRDNDTGLAVHHLNLYQCGRTQQAQFRHAIWASQGTHNRLGGMMLSGVARPGRAVGFQLSC